MTIKTRLLISNILIIILPAIAVLACGVIAFFLLFGIQTDTNFFSPKDSTSYLSVQDAKELIESNEYEKLCDNVSVYRNNDHNYIMVFQDENALPDQRAFSYFERHAFLFFIVFSTFLIFLINRLLAHQILNGIMRPLDILTTGTDEISSGNLSYRISYEKKDEFAPVCAAFNQMTSRLETMTVQRQKEEQNRKVLIAGISHDLRTPLTSIKAYVVGLETGLSKTPQMQQKYLSIIHQKTDILEYIINQLFLFSKLDLGDFPFHIESVNLCDELRQLIHTLKEEYLKKGVILECDTLPETAVCDVDTIQFCNIIQNLWENTAKYKNREQAVSTIRGYVDEEYLQLQVYDNGPGVPEDALEHLFDIFYRTDTARANVSLGSGLGLAISEKIIQSFQGTIQAHNCPGGGLCIEISLPLSHHTKGDAL